MITKLAIVGGIIWLVYAVGFKLPVFWKLIIFAIAGFVVYSYYRQKR